MKGAEGGIISKAPDWKTLFLLKIKSKKTQAAQIKNRNVVFKHFYQNIGTYLD